MYLFVNLLQIWNFKLCHSKNTIKKIFVSMFIDDVDKNW